MKNKTVIIVGAGPTGLAAARELREISNFEVIILEKNPEISYKVCAGGIGPDLSKFGISENIIERTFTEVCISTPWQSAFLKSKNPILATLNRKTLHEGMAEKALDSGAKILFNKHVVDIDRKNKKVITSEGEIFHFDYLIGADGSNSFVRKSLGLEKKNQILAIQYIIPGYYPDIEFHVDVNKFDMSYAWIFPQKDQKDVVSVGAGLYPGIAKISMQDLKNNLYVWAKDRFSDKKSKESLETYPDPEYIKNTKPEAFPILFDYQGFEFEDIFLGGDAAGLAHDFTGGGIESAILSGIDIARKIVDPQYDCPEIKKILEKKRKGRAFVKLMAKLSATERKAIIESAVFLFKVPIFGKKIAAKVL